MGELAVRAIAGVLYPGVKQSDLSEEQKQTISTLAIVSAGLAGGIRGLALSGTKTHVKQCFLPPMPLLMAADALSSPVLPV
ncbi:TPA: VENN motif pre-toxin domain-containing protein [Escherichia coli]|nr:VENN motif pre-toxin domain-containing protein [Escherichia coli]